MEEEARQILNRAVAPQECLGDFFLEVFGADNGADLEVPPREILDPLSLE